jgi:hypothetical protein
MPQPRDHIPARATPASIQAEIVANIRAQPLGPGSVADLAQPESFAARVAGRVMQAWYQERCRIVVDDSGSGRLTDAPNVPDPPSSAVAPQISVTHIRCPDSPALAEAPAAAPPSRNFRWPRLDPSSPEFPYATPAADAPPLPQVATLVAHTLARDGLPACAASCLALLIRSRPALTAEEAVDLLRQAGLPIDLLGCFQPGADSGTGAFVHWLLERLAASGPGRLRHVLDKVPFVFRPSIAGFAALADSGQTRARTYRVQLTRGGYYAGSGDGGSLDIVRQLLEHTDARLVILAEERHLPGFAANAAGWPREFMDRVRVIAQNLPLSQWAQDNGKPGRLPDGTAATLVPRFASRGEETSQFVPGDCTAALALKAAGSVAVQSPLLFQGGNLITVEDHHGRRTLLIGESEVYRNQALGLRREQALAAFRAELGVDNCVVLPSPSIHLDYEVSVRTVGDRVIALVNDTDAARRLVLSKGLEALAAASRLGDAQRSAALQLIQLGRPAELLRELRPALAPDWPAIGHLPLSLADRFGTGPSDSGVGNLVRFLAALDLFAAGSPDAIAAQSDPYFKTFLLACAHQERDRGTLRAALEGLGWTVAPIPGLVLGDRSICPLNGIHAPSLYLMPAHGGLYADVDQAAAERISEILGPQIRILPILCGESQRRNGALRCSVSVVE